MHKGLSAVTTGENVDTTLVRLEVSIIAYGIHMIEHVSKDMNWD